MRFLRKKKLSKTVLVISDIHLGAGTIVKGMRNYLEDFHYDQEMVEFLDFFSSGEYLNAKVELVINGDLFDLLAVPFVEYFDDEFWSEEASLEKLKLIIKAHPEVMEALGKFISHKNKKIIYIIGNHDAELVHPRLQDYVFKQFDEKVREHFSIRMGNEGEFCPVEGVLIKHGHEYEVAHQFEPSEVIQTDELGNKYMIPPWGSYYVTRVLNKFKEERDYINAIRPIKKALINGIIYDTFFTIRFILAHIVYFTMVRFIQIFKQRKSIPKIIEHSLSELELFQDFETLTRDLFESRPDIKCLIVGHTHEPIFRPFADGTIFINTGTWTNMHHMDWGKQGAMPQLTFAQIDVKAKDKKEVVEENDNILNSLDIGLHIWKGVKAGPYVEF
jgi:UDP-2,3-diacylglucosamine pyrophosphatase LpxH